MTTQNRNWECLECGKFLSSKRSHQEHTNTHKKLRPFKCKQCDYAAASEMTLRRHKLRNHSQAEDWGYPCPNCTSIFMEPASYKQHIGIFHPGFSGTFGCFAVECNFKSLSEKHFRSHMKKHAQNEIERVFVSKIRKDQNIVGDVISQSQDEFLIGKTDLCNRYLIDDELGSGNGKPPAIPNTTKRRISETAAVFEKQKCKENPFKRQREAIYDKYIAKIKMQQMISNTQRNNSMTSSKTARFFVVRHPKLSTNQRQSVNFIDSTSVDSNSKESNFNCDNEIEINHDEFHHEEIVENMDTILENESMHGDFRNDSETGLIIPNYSQNIDLETEQISSQENVLGRERIIVSRDDVINESDVIISQNIESEFDVEIVEHEEILGEQIILPDGQIDFELD